LQDVIVPEADHTVPATGEPDSSRVAVVLGGMLAAINFDNEPRFGAEEIDNIWPNRRLAPKAMPIQLLQSQRRPKLLLGVSWIFP
jgi:hypothetical protein